MEDQVNAFESLIDKAKDFGKTSWKLAKLTLVDKASEIVGSVVPLYLIFVFLVTFLLFLNLGLALWLGDVLGKAFYGFFAVAGLYIFLSLLLSFGLYKPVKKWISTIIIRKFLK